MQLGAEDIPELLLIGWDGTQGLDQQLRTLITGFHGLVFERSACSRPLMLITEDPVDQRGGVTGSWLALEGERELTCIRPAVVGVMAAHTRQRAVAGPALVP